MTSPELRVTKSGYGGSGYILPARPGDEKFKLVTNADKQQVKARLDENGKTTVVPGVTTVLKAAAQPGIVQFAVDQTAAKAAASPETLLGYSQERAWGYLRWYWKNEPKEIYDGLDIRNYHKGILNDAAEQGTKMHEWIQADVDTTLVIPKIEADDVNHWQMVTAWDNWAAAHLIDPVMTEITAWNHTQGYAGTFDGLYYIDGKLWLLDIKTSRGLWPDHSRQLAALKEAETYFVKNEAGEWEEHDWQEVVSTIDKFGFIHVRPDDIEQDGRPKPAYCELIEAEDLDLYYEAFLGCLGMKKSELAVAARQKARANADKAQ